jgi:hypothetical protein
MSGRDEGQREDRQPHRDRPHPDKGQRPGGRSASGGRIGVSRISETSFELVHPRCVLTRRPDYEEGIEIWKEGDPEGARDALRYALEGCGENLWIHVALGEIALKEFNDPTLARGHFGYAFELVERALPRGFSGRLPRSLASNRPFYEAAAGLAACYDALGQAGEASKIRAQVDALAQGGGGPQGPRRGPQGRPGGGPPRGR